MSEKAKSYRIIDKQYLWHPYTRKSVADASDFPIITQGQGVFLVDTNGKKYVDAISSWWACNLGHSHPRVIDAIVHQTRNLQHSILGNLSHPGAIELAERLGGLFAGEHHILFASDGASAVEAALKIVLQYWWNQDMPQRNRIVSLENGYHGDTLGAVSVGYVEKFHKPFSSMLAPGYRAQAPICAHCKYGQTPSGCSIECFESMERIVETHIGEIAAVIVEPMCQGAAGMNIYPSKYLQRLGNLCRTKKILLIADEIAVGFGRTGKMFAYEHAQITPDIVCLGKSLSAGYLPISATVVSDKIYETFSDGPGARKDCTFYHGHTFSGNPIAASAAIETMRIYQEQDIVSQAKRKGDMLKSQLDALIGGPGILDVRCLGMIGAVELDATAGATARIVQQLLGEGILIRPLGNVFYLMLPLVTPEEVLTSAAASFCQAISETMKSEAAI